MPYVVGGDDIRPTRKRSWDDGDRDSFYRLYNSDKEKQNFYILDAAQDFPATRKVLPLSSKRARITSDDDGDAHSPGRDAIIPAHRRRFSPQRVLQDQPKVGNKAPLRPAAALLIPCYICHRRPTKKSDLDSFAECQGCGERACYVCIRQCHGWNADDGMSVISEQEVLSRSFHMDDADDVSAHQDIHDRNDQEQQICREEPHNPCENEEGKRGKWWAASGHRSVVCSRCCVERGREGEVVCLGCLSAMPGA
ncbi:hypothetical protein QQS21_004992 [Conoideocrella luteorostrata]|uniref:Uncharacterized protein n=1 Tax=Conoideocrella luteorostrata TaxID=1105319 RepID=A0AAJ0CQA0_9HYPO|nr:hypothetical protein QQS21_004992 [Conoideocrella luteorostrata]